MRVAHGVIGAVEGAASPRNAPLPMRASGNWWFVSVPGLHPLRWTRVCVRTPQAVSKHQRQHSQLHHRRRRAQDQAGLAEAMQ